MRFRRQPLSVCVAAFVLFGVTAILPVGYMLIQLVVRLFEQPATVTKLLIDARQLVLLGRSLAIALSSAAVALAIGLPVAMILASRDLPLRRLFYFLVLVPVLIPPYVMAGAWIHLLSPMGPVNRILAAVFGPSARLSLHSAAGCAWCLGVSFFPVIAIVVATGLSKLDNSLQDAARLSTNRWGVFRHSTLPQIRPHLAASFCLVLIFVLAQYGVPSLLGVNTYPVEIFAYFSAFYDDTAAVATSLPLIALVIFLIVFQRMIMRGRDYVSVSASSERGMAAKLGGLRPWAVLFMATVFVVTVVLPFASVLAYAHGLGRVFSAVGLFSDYVLTTSVLGLLAAVICTAIAFPIGHYLAHGRGVLAGAVDIVCWLPVAIPGTIVGIGLIETAGVAPVLKTDSFGVLLLVAYVGMFSAFSIRVFDAGHRRSDPNLDEAAALDCRNWPQRLLHVELPAHSGAIAVSAIMVFVLVVGELNATVLLIPPGKSTLSVSIDNLLHYGASAAASELCLIEAGLVILTIGLGLLAWRATRRVLGWC